jgi:hypothetical protein
VDSADPSVLARFWADALGWRITYTEPDEHVIEPPEGSPECDVCPDILFGKSDDPKAGKNRLHLDLRPEDQDAEVERLLSLGASRVDIGQSGDETWVVLQDPEGNEFCVLRALTAEEMAS